MSLRAFGIWLLVCYYYVFCYRVGGKQAGRSPDGKRCVWTFATSKDFQLRSQSLRREFLDCAGRGGIKREGGEKREVSWWALTFL